MFEVNLAVYVNALFILMISSISAYIFIIYKLRNDNYPTFVLRYYNVYFILGVFGWIGLWGKDSSFIDNDLTLSVISFVLVSLFLLLAVMESAYKNWNKKIIVLVHVAAIVVSLFLNNDFYRLIYISLYTLVVYPLITYLSMKLAYDNKNIGNGIIGLAALLVICLAPIQLYGSLVLDDFSFVYGVTLIGSSTGFVLVGIGFLSSLLINEHNQLTQLTLEDPLTCLFNRRGLDHAVRLLLPSAQRNKSCISAITMDIDHFKKINDTYGHEGGDFVLKEFSRELMHQARSSDACCRLGGEEFVMVLPATTKTNAFQVAERIRESIEKMVVTYGNKMIRLTSSFGVSTQCTEIDIDYLLKDADKALYQAKAEGRNRTCLSDDVDVKVI